MRGLAVMACCLLPWALSAFEKIAYVDSIDYADTFDTETAEGSRRIVEHVLLTGATTLLWRNQNGALPTFPSAEETLPLKEPPLDKRRIPMSRSAMGWARFDECGTDLVRAAKEACEGRGVRFGLHVTTEENHYAAWTLGAWNLEHPQYWCCKRGDVPAPGCCSRAYPEVRAHKQRLFAEMLSYGPAMVTFDVYRSGGWTPALEYVEPVEREWRRRYGCKPPANPKDPRWVALVAESVFAHFSALRGLARKSGQAVEFVMAAEYFGREEDFDLVNRGIDWRAMLRAGVIDAVAVASVVPDWNDPWGSTEAIYRGVVREAKAIRKDARVYFPIMSYNFSNRPGYSEYAKRCGVSQAEAVARLLRLAKEAGGDGITMEVVDFGNYSPEVCSVLREFN